MAGEAKEGDTPSVVADPTPGDAAPIEVVEIQEEIEVKKEWLADLEALETKLRSELKQADPSEREALTSRLETLEAKLSEATETISTLQAELVEAKKGQAPRSGAPQSTQAKSRETPPKSDGAGDRQEADESKKTAPRKRNRGSWI